MSADRYTLPAETKIGGEWIEVPGSRRGDWVSLGQADGGEEAIVINVRRSWLTPVKPPREEPPRGSVVLDCEGRAWQRTGGFRGEWDCTQDDLGADWKYLSGLAPVLLAEDPFAEPVQLPWRETDGSPLIASVSLDHGIVAVRFGIAQMGKHFSPTAARAFARAVWAAANQADKDGTE